MQHHQRLILGFHISKTRDLNTHKRSIDFIDAIKSDIGELRDAGIESPCAQIFATGPRKAEEILTHEDKIKIKEYVKKSKLPLVIHGAYIDNPWSRDKPNHFPIHNIRKELRIAGQIGATGVIIHAANGANDTVSKVLPAIAKDLDGDLTLWIEINAAKPTENTFETPEKIHALFSKIRKLDLGNLNVGLCIDTAHLHSCGVSLVTYNEASTWLRDLKHLLHDIPIMMHLNDSGSILGSGIDTHACLTRGNIWGIYHNRDITKSGLMAVLEWCAKYDIMCILERGEGVMNDVKLIRDLGY